MSKTELYLSKIIQYGLYAILLTPLVFWPRALYGFMTPKFILFQVLIEIVFVAWLALKVLNNANRKNRYANNTNRESKSLAISGIRNNYILLALSGFFVVSFISAFFGIDFSRSFWGIGARMTGLFAELHFFAWFLVLTSSLSNANNANDKIRMPRIANNTSEKFAISNISNKFLNWHYYINFSFFIALLVTLSAFYQNTDWRLVYGSTFFNNPTFVAPYFLFHFFWGLYQTLVSPFWEKWFFGLSAALLALVIFLGEIRGAILGLFIGLFIFSLGLIFSNVISRRFKILISAFFVAIFFILSGLWFARESAFVQNTSTLKRLTQLSLEQTTVQTRFAAWHAAFQGFKEYPFLGVGPENFNYVFNAHYNPALLKYGLGETWFDKPHNAFLEILTEIGAVGGLAYLLILMTVAFALFKLFKSGQKILVLVLSGALIAHLSSMFFSLDSFGSWFGLYLMLGFLVLQNNANEIQEMRIPLIANFYSQLASLAVVVGLLALLYVNYGIWRANIADADALRIFSRDPAQGIILFKKSLTYFSPYKPEYQFDLIASIAGAVEKGVPLPSLEDTINFSLSEADKAVAAHPKDAAKYTDMIRIYNIFGTRGRDPEILVQAEVFGDKSLELSPNRQETLFYLARTALLKNDFKSAVKLTKLAVDADPEINLSHWYLGLALIANDQRSEGKVEIKKALELGYKPQNQAEIKFIEGILK